MSDSSTLEGTRLGAYRIERQLGEGAMGDVFLAVHEALGRQVAIKKLKPHVAADRAMTERFFAEARAVNIIRHENIVECTDLVNEAGTSYIVMELLEGKTLSAAIRQAKQMSPVRAAKIAAQIADALAAAHTKGIVHRDLKPDNVFLIKRAGSADYVKVLDFGMARLRPELGGVQATQSGALVGTPAYMSPEQARGERVGPPADIYALGVVTFHMLTGQLPFTAESLTMMLIQIVQETPPSVDKLAKDTPKPLVDLVRRCLEKDADNRPADMASLRRELLESVGLPFEVAQSVAGSQSPLADKAIGLEATLDTGPKPIVDVSALAETSAPGLAATTAPVWSGQSSLTAASGQVSTRAKKRPWTLIGGGAGAAVVVAIVAIVALSKSGNDNRQPAASSPSPAATSPAPSTTVVPDPPAPKVEQPAPQPEAPPPVAIETKATGSAASETKAEAKAATIKKTTTKATAKTNTKTTVAKTGAGSAAAPPIETKPEPKPEEKIDLTKQLVGPKPPGT
jgi:serine/threonine-protein kinase